MVRVDSSGTHPHSSVTDTSLGVFFMYGFFSIFLFPIISFCEDTFLGGFFQPNCLVKGRVWIVSKLLQPFFFFLHDYNYSRTPVTRTRIT